MLFGSPFLQRRYCPAPSGALRSRLARLDSQLNRAAFGAEASPRAASRRPLEARDQARRALCALALGARSEFRYPTPGALARRAGAPATFPETRRVRARRPTGRAVSGLHAIQPPSPLPTSSNAKQARRQREAGRRARIPAAISAQMNPSNEGRPASEG